MEDGATWTKLAAHARFIANDMRDPYAQKTMREIADRYEKLARRATGQRLVTPRFSAIPHLSGDATQLA